jgi:cellulose synthase/poly-beta-1,6-N-acetylglucosamine synthase-like glycosyltransferase
MTVRFSYNHIKHIPFDATTMKLILVIEAAFFCYFIASSALYLWTAIHALRTLPRCVKRHKANPLKIFHSRFEKPVSVIIPAFNESGNLVATVRSVLRFDYPEYEVIVVNDGSTDDTLTLLLDAFALQLSMEPYRLNFLPTGVVRGIYKSRTYPKLRVVDKENAGKSDALNVGINVANYPLLLCVDGDSYYVPETLTVMSEPFLRDPHTVISGAVIGVSNGCEFRDGALVRVCLGHNPIVIFQVLEYLRAFLQSRLTWAGINALDTVSGALGMFRKDVVIEAGGFRTDIMGEDTELTIRVHHFMRAQRRPYRIAFTPYPVCWTMVPETLSALWKQRVRWHRSLGEVVAIHRRLLFHNDGGAIGWLTFPVLALFEWLSPLVVLFGIGFGIDAFFLGVLSIWSQIVLALLFLSLASLVSVTAVLLDVISFGTYGFNEVLRLMFFLILENFGYRQFGMLANLAGLFRWMFYRRVRRRKVVGLFVREYDPIASANWRYEATVQSLNSNGVARGELATQCKPKFSIGSLSDDTA